MPIPIRLTQTAVQRYDRWHTTIGSVGRLLPNQLAKQMSPFLKLHSLTAITERSWRYMLGSSETALPSGSTGELWIKGPDLLAGYLNNPSPPPMRWQRTDSSEQAMFDSRTCRATFQSLIVSRNFSSTMSSGRTGGAGGVADRTRKGRGCLLSRYVRCQTATENPRAFTVTTETGVNREVFANERTTWWDTRVAKHKKSRGGICFLEKISKTVSGKILEGNFKR